MGSLSPATVRYRLNILNKALKQAVNLGYIARNVAQAVERPRVRRPAVVTMALQDIPRFLEAAYSTFYYRLFYTALWTGMRLSEFLGVRWCDVYLELGYQSMAQSLYKHGDVCEFMEPKNPHSWHCITLSQSFIELFREHRREQEAHGLMLDRPLDEIDLIFNHPDNITGPSTPAP